MAHFAELGPQNQVLRVIAIRDSDMLDSNGIESEEIGIAYCNEIVDVSEWKQTSYNGNFRRLYAAIGSVYRDSYDAFMPPPRYRAWTFNETLWDWEPPVPMPFAIGPWEWDSSNNQWTTEDV